ncbi:addiction module protein [bacterium]|nr:addiction module protein [bacterium]
MPASKEILKEALNLTPEKKVELIEKLLISLDNSDKEFDMLWAKEAETRIDAYEQGKIKSLTIEEILEKYK